MTERAMPVEMTMVAGLFAAAGGLAALIAQGAAAGFDGLCLRREAVTVADNSEPAAMDGWGYQLQVQTEARAPGVIEFTGRLQVSGPA